MNNLGFISYKVYYENALFEEAQQQLITEGFKYFDETTRNKILELGKKNELTNDDIINLADELMLMIKALVYVKADKENKVNAININLSKLRKEIMDFFEPEKLEVNALGIRKATIEGVKNKIKNTSKEGIERIKNFLMPIIKMVPQLKGNEVIELNGTSLQDMQPEIKKITTTKTL